MRNATIAGPGAGVRKYDVLTALAAWGLHGTARDQTSALRLIALVTARYNWQRDELSVGQRDMARLWGVADRTVKRELKRLAAHGVLVVLRRGVKGRVACYRIDQERVAALSAPYWQTVGPDFADRFGARHGVATPSSSVVRVDFGPGRDGPADTSSGQAGDLHGWLRAHAPESYGAWFARLRVAGEQGDQVVLECPNAFVRGYVETHFDAVLRDAVATIYGPGRRVVLTVTG